MATMGDNLARFMRICYQSNVGGVELMKLPDWSNISTQNAYLRRSAAIVAGTAALLLPGGLLIMYAIWLYRRSQLAQPKSAAVKA